MKNKSDNELMRLYQQGDNDAFCELHARYQGMLYGLAYTWLKELAPELISDAHDIVQNVFAWVHINRHQLSTRLGQTVALQHNDPIDPKSRQARTDQAT